MIAIIIVHLNNVKIKNSYIYVLYKTNLKYVSQKKPSTYNKTFSSFLTLYKMRSIYCKNIIKKYYSYSINLRIYLNKKIFVNKL